MHLSPNQWQVLLCIIRKTYGFHKKVDYIANFQIGNATGLGKTVVSRCLSGLAELELITRKGKFIGFQKDWERWKGLTFQQPLERPEPAKMRIVRDDGYVGIWHRSVEPEFQSMATKQGYILEHRLVMARSLGRCLESWEVVHHKGTKYPIGSLEDKADNRDENLELLPSQAAHMPSILAQQKIKQLESELAILRTSVDEEEELAKRSPKVSSTEVTQKIKDTTTKDKKYILPEWIDQSTWDDFMEMRRKKRAIPTEKAKELLVKALDRLRQEGHDPTEVLNQSIMRNYTGVFPLKEVKNGETRRHNGTRELPKRYRRPEEIFGDKDA